MTIQQIAILFFVTLVSLFFSVYLWYRAVTTSPKNELKKRLRKIAVNSQATGIPDDLRIEILKNMNVFDRFLIKIKPLKKLANLIERADLNIGGAVVDLRMFLMITTVSGIIVSALSMLVHRDVMVSGLFFLAGAMLPLGFLPIRVNQRMTKFTQQFPDTLDMIARSLRAGHSLTSAIGLVGKEMSQPVAGIFKTAYEEQALGVSIIEAVEHMGDRVESTDLRFFIMAVNIHKESGGNLSEILENLAKTIRERLKIRRQVKVYTAQARLSGYILAVAPLAMAVIFYFASPGYIEELFKVPQGRHAVALAIAGQITGFLIIKKIISIRI